MPAMKFAPWIAVGLLAAASGAALAQGTEAQREACMPDAFRLCSSSIPDASRVESCLRDAGPRLSSACYAVFYPPVATEPMRSVRRQLPRPDDDD